MKKIIGVVILLIIVAVLVLWKLSIDEGTQKATAKQALDPTVYVDAFVVRDTTAEYNVTAVGNVKAYEDVNLVSELNRKLVGIYMKEGAKVTKGQLLFKLDDEDLVAKLNKLKIEEELAKATEEREKARLKIGGISQQSYDIVYNNLQKIQADMKILEVELAKTEIRAPFSGKLGLRNISLGAYLSPNVLLATLQDLSKVKIDFSVPERYANDVKVNKSILFKVEYMDKPIEAKVEAVEPSLDLNTRSLLVRAVAGNGKELLVPGSSVKLDLELSETAKTMFVPSSALIPTTKGYQAYIVKDGKAMMVDLLTGVRAKELVQILQGLQFGDTLITTNILRLKPNVPVKVTKIG